MLVTLYQRVVNDDPHLPPADFVNRSNHHVPALMFEAEEGPRIIGHSVTVKIMGLNVTPDEVLDAIQQGTLQYEIVDTEACKLLGIKIG